jgi:outer membrane lipoprotein carrier protein
MQGNGLAGWQRWVRTLCWVALTVTTQTALAEGLQSLQDFLQYSTLGQAEFVQKVTSPTRDGKPSRIKTSQGRLIYQRPDHFRIDYTRPDELTLLGDGKQFWYLDQGLQQVTVRDQKTALAQAPITLMLTANRMDALRASFDLSGLPDAEGLSWVDIVPKSTEGTLRQLKVGFQGQGRLTQVAVLEFTDGFGQASRLELTPAQSLPQINAQTFQLKIPAGFQVLRP